MGWKTFKSKVVAFSGGPKTKVFGGSEGPNPIFFPKNEENLNFFKKFRFASFLEKIDFDPSEPPKTFVLGPPEKAKTFDLKVFHPKKKVQNFWFWLRDLKKKVTPNLERKYSVFAMGFGIGLGPYPGLYSAQRPTGRVKKGAAEVGKLSQVGKLS